MKYYYFILLAFILSGCEFRNIEITGTAQGMDGSTVTIKSQGKVLFGENIQNGKFHVVQQLLKEPGYYTLELSKPGAPENYFEIYLEPGKYNIVIDTGKHHRYPTITSSSLMQNDLTIYHRFTDSVMNGIKTEADKWLSKLNAPEAMLLPQKQYQDILAKVKIWQDKSTEAQVTTLDQFVSKYPNNIFVPHAMKRLKLSEEPAKFTAIYNKLGNDVKNSEDGKKIDNELKNYSKLAPGAIAPELEGLTPDGKKINIKDLHQKAVIIAFWRSGWSIIKDDQFAIVNTLIPSLKGKAVCVIGVSFDTDRSKWLETIKERGLNFTQISDLKGDDSPNAKNWNTTLLPNYFILDGEGKILYKDLSYAALTLSIKEYLAKH